MPIILMRNLDFSQGLANGTRLIVMKLGTNVIHAKIMTGSKTHIGKTVIIPRIPLTPTDTIQMPIRFTRKQFPVRPAFAMTINKSQGQTFDMVGIYLPRPVFSHGQLYVAMSRVGSAAGIKFMVLNGRNTAQPAVTSDHVMTPNIVYQEILNAADASPAGLAAAEAWRQQQSEAFRNMLEDQEAGEWPP